MWHEVIDRPGSYAEFSATAMIATAMLRARHREGGSISLRIQRVRPPGEGSSAVSVRTAYWLDVCESTGKQKSLEELSEPRRIFRQGRTRRRYGVAASDNDVGTAFRAVSRRPITLRLQPLRKAEGLMNLLASTLLVMRIFSLSHSSLPSKR